MQIELLIEKNSSLSISSWIIDYYLTKKSLEPRNIIGIYDMFRISQVIQPSLSTIEFFDLCKNKLKQIKNNFLIENYNKYLNRCDLSDIIDIFHQCQFHLINNTMDLSIKNNIDQLFFEYLTELSSTEINENLIENSKISNQQTNSKVSQLIDS